MFALHFTLHSKPDTCSISARDRPGIRDTQPDPYGLPVSRSHSRSGVGEFSLGLSPISVGFRYLLHEIGPMTRNPERDTERSQVVRARSPSLPVPGPVHGPVQRLVQTLTLIYLSAHYTLHLLDMYNY